jgi:crossover junction endodeoxyribonuclease RuvC
MIIMGIDPGLNGAIAYYTTDVGHLTIVDMPTVEVERNKKTKREVSAHGFADLFLEIKPNVAFIERVGAMPGQGVSSVFSFGRSVGVIEGVLAMRGVPTTLVIPQRWQKACDVRGGKDGSRERAMQLFPDYSELFKLKKHDGRADAALIAYYGSMQQSK